MDKFFSQPFTFDRTVRIVFSVLICMAIVWGVYSLWNVLLPFLLAGIFAYVLMPVVRFFQHTLRLRSRGLSVVIVFVLLVVIVSTIVGYIVPAVQQEVAKTIDILYKYDSQGGLLAQIAHTEWVSELINAWRSQGLVDYLQIGEGTEMLRTLMEQVGSFISNTLSIFSWGVVLFMGLMYFIFILLDFEGLAHGLLSLIPKHLLPMFKTMLAEGDYYMNNYFRSQALVALSVALLLSIGFNIVGLPLATAMGIFIGLLNFIPYMQALGILPLGLSALLMAAQTGQNVFVCLLLAYGVLVLVQIVQDGLIVPRIMGYSMGMRPSLILLSLAIWGGLLGFFGMLIALPLTMVIYSFYMRYILNDQAYASVMDKKIEAWRSKEKNPNQASKSVK